MTYTVLLSLGPLWLAAALSRPIHLVGVMLGWRSACVKVEIGYWGRIGIHVSGMDIERK